MTITYSAIVRSVAMLSLVGACIGTVASRPATSLAHVVLPTEVPPTTMPAPHLPLHRAVRPLSCRRALHFVSRTNTRQTYINFINRKDVRVGVYWLDYSGTMQFYVYISPGGHHLQQTYVTHPWVILRKPVASRIRVGRCIEVFMPAPVPANAVIT